MLTREYWGGICILVGVVALAAVCWLNGYDRGRLEAKADSSIVHADLEQALADRHQVFEWLTKALEQRDVAIRESDRRSACR